MDSLAITARVNGDGQVSLPENQRKLLGLENGGGVLIRVIDGEWRIKPIRTAMDEVEALAALHLVGKDSVDDFLKDRRAEEAIEQSRP